MKSANTSVRKVWIPGRTVASHQAGMLCFLGQHILILGQWSQEMPVTIRGRAQDTSGLAQRRCSIQGPRETRLPCFPFQLKIQKQQHVAAPGCAQTGAAETQAATSQHGHSPEFICCKAAKGTAPATPPAFPASEPELLSRLSCLRCPVLRIHICLVFCSLQLRRAAVKASLLPACSPRGDRSCQSREKLPACISLGSAHSCGVPAPLGTALHQGVCSASSWKEGTGEFFQCCVIQAGSFTHTVQYFFIKSTVKYFFIKSTVKS